MTFTQKLAKKGSEIMFHAHLSSIIVIECETRGRRLTYEVVHDKTVYAKVLCTIE